MPDDEEVKFAIKSEDFARDLCSIMDVLQPIVDIMVKAQSLSMPIWKVVLWLPRLLSHLDGMDAPTVVKMPRLESALKTLRAETSTFLGVEVEEGWVIQSTTVESASDGPWRRKPKTLINWVERDENTCLQEASIFLKDVSASVAQRFEYCTGGWKDVATVS